MNFNIDRTVLALGYGARTPVQKKLLEDLRKKLFSKPKEVKKFILRKKILEMHLNIQLNQLITHWN